VTRPLRRSGAALGAILLAATLALSGCGKSGTEKVAPTPTASAPTPSVQVPSGVTLTAPGTDLKFGDSATVPYRPNDKRGSVLELKVKKVIRANISDFSSYVLNAHTLTSTPYYVRVKVRNVGAGDVGGTDVPVWAVDGNNTLVHSSSFTNTFKRCPSTALPANFAPSAATTACLVFLLPDHGTLAGVSFRPLQSFAPIEWTGTITHPAKKPAKQTKHTKKKKS
jgi:hypothetical protein